MAFLSDARYLSGAWLDRIAAQLGHVPIAA
jgi:hypothetical protein